jgi:Right handed beta helix region
VKSSFRLPARCCFRRRAKSPARPVRGGYTNSFGGGGIAILSSSPTIRENIITDNQVCNSGGGISSFWGSPLIEHNTITHNSMRGRSGGWGLGVYIYGNSSAEIVGNLITENNDTRVGAGGGVALFSAGNPTVRGNVISNNVIVPPWGGVVNAAAPSLSPMTCTERLLTT